MKNLGHVKIKSVKLGAIINPAAFWIGAHWSPYNRRLCVNVLPCCTIWVTFKGGVVPSREKA